MGKLTVLPVLVSVLRLIHDRLRPSDVSWVLTGSLAFALQGLPVTPQDIDLQTDADGAYAIERHLAEFVIQPVRFSASQRLRSHYGKLAIHGVQVEIIGELEKRRPDGSWEPAPDLESERRLVSLGGWSLPVLSLAYETQAYDQMGRHERAAQLRAWIRDSLPGTPDGRLSIPKMTDRGSG